MMEKILATGRRKEATACVTLIQGKGEIKINNKEVEKYFEIPRLLKQIETPLEITGTKDKFDIIAKVKGGGKSGQASAVVLGIARALVKLNSEFKTALKSNGLLKRDPRKKERRKYGRKKARRGQQWTKR